MSTVVARGPRRRTMQRHATAGVASCAMFNDGLEQPVPPITDREAVKAAGHAYSHARSLDELELFLGQLGLAPAARR